MPDLAEMIAGKFSAGAEEIILRVARYERDARTPCAFQAIVRYADRNIPWGGGVDASSEAALRIALGAPSAMTTDKTDEGVFG